MKVPAYQNKLSAKDIFATSTKFPEEMREPFIWLAEFLRDECYSNVDLVEPLIRKVGLSTTGSTIIKLVMGRWDVDAAGNKVAPIISIKNFIQLVDRVRKQERLKKLQGEVPFIETSAWRQVHDYIQVRRAEHSICKFGLILGPTGSQKGACEQHFCTIYNHGACTYIESPYKPSMRHFIRAVTRSFGVRQYKTLAVQQEELEAGLNPSRTLIIANIQRMYRRNSGWDQEVFNWLQYIQEVTRCTVIMEAATDSEFASTFRAGRELGYFEQFVGRCGGECLILPDYPPAEDLVAIGSAFGLPDSKETEKILDSIARKEGRVRTLFNTLQKAARAANGAKQPLTLTHVREAMNVIEKEEKLAADKTDPRRNVNGPELETGERNRIAELTTTARR